MSQCVFCAIVAGQAPAHVVADEPAGLAFLDTRPVFPGHVLVVPREHYETLPDLPVTTLADFFGLVRRISIAVPAGVAADGTFVAINNVVSQSVAHLHAHVVPRRRRDGLRGFFWPRASYPSAEQAAQFAARIRDALPE